MVSEIRVRKVPNCPMCGHKGIPLYSDLQDRLYGVEGRWGFSRCPNCGLVWLDPRPILEDIPKCYPDDYFSHKLIKAPHLGSSSIRRLVRLAVLSNHFNYKHLGPQIWYASLLGKIAMLIPSLRRKVTMGLGTRLLPYRKGGRILDIGCGNGFYLALMKQLGWEVTGIEMDPVAAEIARSRFGIFVHVGTPDDAPLEQETFDTVVMSHVIEHVPDPVHFIRTAARFLKPGGQMVVVTPNVQSLGHRLFNKDWYALQPPQHLVLFEPKTLKRCFTKAGVFRQIRISTTPRISRKVFRKFVLVRQTGWFRHESESALTRKRWIQVVGWLFGLVEALGNPLLQWGEEIECVATKA